MTPDASMSSQQQDRRVVARRKTLKGVTISFNGGMSTFEGVARNLSETGARLSFCETFAIPSEVLVRMGGEMAWRPAVLRWRSMTDVGVEYGRP